MDDDEQHQEVRHQEVVGPVEGDGPEPEAIDPTKQERRPKRKVAAILGEAQIAETEKGATDPKVIAATLLIRTLSNFRGAIVLAREGRVNPWLMANHPVMNPPPPEGYMWSLPLLYAVFFVVVAVLYVPCRWFAAVNPLSPKTSRPPSGR